MRTKILVSTIAFSLMMTNAGAAENPEKTEAKPGLPIEELRAFSEIYNRIKSAYVEEVDDEVLINGAIAGMLSALDPHSGYLNNENFNNLQDSTAGQYGGLGIEVVPDDRTILIVSPIDDSPAERAGIKAGDRIIRINNSPISRLPSNEALELMRGELGEEIELTIRREGEAEPLEFKLTRSIIKVSSVSGEWLGQDIGYVRIAQFQNRTADELNSQIREMQEAHGSLKGLILDLRNNPGGTLSAAEDVSDAFLERGLIVSTQGKISSANYSAIARPGDLLSGAPMIVLINGGSASASEIVAGALQDHRRAIIMGTRSFGKGSVQTLMTLPTDAALKLTTARYYTPSGQSIQGKGILPDIIVKPAKLVAEASTQPQLSESDLRGSLSAEDETPQSARLSEEGRILLSRDYQLTEAMNLIRGLSLLGRTSSRQE